MEFNSLEEAMAYINQSITNSMPEVANEIKIIMDDNTINQVEGWTGQIFDSVVPNSNGNMAEAGFEDVGSWYSLISGEEVGNPIKFLEAGSTWNRSASNIMEESYKQSLITIPDEFKKRLIGLGIPIE